MSVACQAIRRRKQASGPRKKKFRLTPKSKKAMK
jgi:hypothetical protein